MHTVVVITGFAAVAAAAGTVSVPIAKHRPSKDTAIVRRDDSSSSGSNQFDWSVINNITGGGYFAEFAVGTPPQKLSFIVDTGSSDTWVNSNEADYCVEGEVILGEPFPPDCLPQFDPDASSTFEHVSYDFQVNYLDGSDANGEYFNDTVTFGDEAVIEEQQLGLAEDTSHPTGIVGLGLRSGLASTDLYPTILEKLVSSGIIDTPAFSLYLDSLSQEEGSILFGGIDTKKYVGNLVSLPLEPDTISNEENITSYSVSLKGFSADGFDGRDIESVSTGAIFDSGTTITLLPDEAVKPIWEELGVEQVYDVDSPFIDCKYAEKEYSKYKFHFEFDGLTITVPLRQMVVNSFTKAQQGQLGSLFTFDNICLFGLGSSSGYIDEYGNEPEFALLGDTFLRSAYVVHDLANQQLAVAPAYKRSEESNVVALKANSSLPMMKGMDGEFFMCTEAIFLLFMSFGLRGLTQADF